MTRQYVLYLLVLQHKIAVVKHFYFPSSTYYLGAGHSGSKKPGWTKEKTIELSVKDTYFTNAAMLRDEMKSFSDVLMRKHGIRATFR
jgi:hypothetical protein